MIEASPNLFNLGLDDHDPANSKAALEDATSAQGVHIIMTATQSNVNLCKTLLTLTILGYPTPHLVAWGDDYSTGNLLAGGSHFAKITGTLDYINAGKRREQPAFEDDDIIFMLDAYDIWFQLPFQVLVSRYHEILAQENMRLAQRMGRAYEREGLAASVIFGGGKRYFPNFINSLACYPIPESPIPKSIRNGNTDSALGRNEWSSFRTRYLNSGYLIGPVGRVSRILEEARQRLDMCKDQHGADFDDGSGASDECYHGSDQSIFVDMFGVQEFHREVMRRHHSMPYDEVLGKVDKSRPRLTPPPTQIMGTEIVDLLNPAWPHQHANADYMPGKPFEMGIVIDYWSLLGHQTSNADDDRRHIRYNTDVTEQIGVQGQFDCIPQARFPHDLYSHAQNSSVAWNQVPLYMAICTDNVPVMIHHNSIEKWNREEQWDKTWWNGSARAMMEEQRRLASPILVDGIATDKGFRVSWDELCPVDFEPELYRDIAEKRFVRSSF